MAKVKRGAHARVLRQSKSLLMSVFEKPEHTSLNQMDIGIVKMNDVFVRISEFRHSHSALLAKAYTMAKSFSCKDNFIIDEVDFELCGA